jgi:hypothetical protein
VWPDEHGHVERPVLLGTEHLLALVEQDRDLERVVDEQVIDAGAGLKLGDRRTALERVLEREVARDRRGVGDQREDRERPGDVGAVDGEVDRGRGGGCRCRHVAFSFSAGLDRESPARSRT